MSLDLNPAYDLIWADFEFTGLNPDVDLLLEVGFVATTSLFETIGEMSLFVSQDIDHVEARIEANPWWDQRADHKELMLRGVLESEVEVASLDNAVSEFIMRHYPNKLGEVVLAGNTIDNDRRWTRRYMPESLKLLHYRQFEVGTLKILARNLANFEFVKEERHRSLDDIYESIEEAKATLTAITTVSTKTSNFSA